MIDQILAQFTTRDYVILVGILLAQIPFIIMINYYLQTGIRDFLLGGLIILSGSLSLLLTQFFFLNILWFYIIANISFLSTYFLLFLHSMRYKWKTPPRALEVLGVLIYAIIVVMILLYQFQDISATARVLGIEMQAINRKTGEIPQQAAVFQINRTIVIGSAFLVLVDLYRLGSALLFFYVYLTTPLSYENETTRRNRVLILIIAVLNMIHPVMITLVGLQFITITYVVFNLINAAFIIMLAYIGIVHPHTLSLSHVQVIRTLSLYKIIEKQESEEDSYGFGMRAVMKYVDRVSKIREKMG